LRKREIETANLRGGAGVAVPCCKSGFSERRIEMRFFDSGFAQTPHVVGHASRRQSNFVFRDEFALEGCPSTFAHYAARVRVPSYLQPTAQFHVHDPSSDAISASLRKAVSGRGLVLG
jgi:hypothetical protein